MKKAVFLDRDGVINHDPGDYTKSISEFQILPGVCELIAAINQKGYEIILITNQAGIAKGLYTHDAVAEIHAFLELEIEKSGGKVLDIWYAPDHESKSKSLFRKPGSLMIERAAALHDIDLQQSWMVGDKVRDLDCAERAGVKHRLLIPTNATFKSLLDLL